MATIAHTEVLIAGGGLTGITAALALSRAGVHTTVVEALPHAASDRWGLTLWPTGVAVLKSLGLFDRIAKDGCQLQYLRWFVEAERRWISVCLRSPELRHEFMGIRPSRLIEIATQEALTSGVVLMRPFQIVAVRSKTLGELEADAESVGERSVSINCRVLIVAGGVESRLRESIGFDAVVRRSVRQLMITGVGSGVPFAESRQVFGKRWSAGCVSLGPEKTWFYAVVPTDESCDHRKMLERYLEFDPEAVSGFRGLSDIHALSPTAVRVPRWSKHGCLVLGDSAHGMYPYLGLGGNASLEDIPVLADVLLKTLRNRCLDMHNLHKLQQRRSARVAYLRRVSEFFSLCLTSSVPGSTFVRDWNFRRLDRHPELLQKYLRELAGGGVPSIRTRLGVFLP